MLWTKQFLLLVHCTVFDPSKSLTWLWLLDRGPISLWLSDKPSLHIYDPLKEGFPSIFKSSGTGLPLGLLILIRYIWIIQTNIL
jgi:hypothetical protein